LKRLKGETYLKPLSKNKPSWKAYAVYDIETLPTLDRVYLVGFYDGESYRYFESKPLLPQHPASAVSQFLTWLFSTRRYCKYQLYAHNAGNFDVLYLIRWLMDRLKDYGAQAIPIQSTILSISVLDKISRRHWQFYDSNRLIPGGLDKLGKAFGLGGKIDGIDYSTLHRNPKRYEYLERDCRLLYGVILKFRQMIYDGGGDLGITAPATAMKTYRRSYMKQWIPINKHFPGCEEIDK